MSAARKAKEIRSKTIGGKENDIAENFGRTEKTRGRIRKRARQVASAKWYARQLRWIADTKFNVAVAKSPEDALAAVRDRRFLSQRTKDGIAALLAVQYRESYTPAMIESLF